MTLIYENLLGTILNFKKTNYVLKSSEITIGATFKLKLPEIKFKRLFFKHKSQHDRYDISVHKY